MRTAGCSCPICTASAPIWERAARGVFFGITAGIAIAISPRAVLEGVAFSLRQMIGGGRGEEGGDAIARVLASGGPASIPLWNSIKATVLNRPLVIPQVTHAACLGAAMLAAIGSGWYHAGGPAAEAMVQAAQQVEPETRFTARYDALFAVYANLYPQLRGAYGQLAAIHHSEGLST